MKVAGGLHVPKRVEKRATFPATMWQSGRVWMQKSKLRREEGGKREGRGRERGRVKWEGRG